MAIKNSAFRRTYEIQKGFLEDIQALTVADLLVQFVHSITTKGKKKILKDIMPYFQQWNYLYHSNKRSQIEYYFKKILTTNFILVKLHFIRLKNF